jgi:signal transduction histidine kinase/ActR/RegA family two-component response regulator
MKKSLIFYISLITLIGIALLSYDLSLIISSVSISESKYIDMAIWMLIIIIVSRFHISSASGQAMSTMNSALDYCIILSFGAPFAAVAVAINSVYLNYRKKSPWYKVLFNTGQLVIAINLAGGLYVAAGGVTGEMIDFTNPYVYLKLPIPFFAFSFANLMLVSIAVKISQGVTIRSQVKVSHYFETWSSAILFYFGILLSALYLKLSWVGVMLGMVPLAWAYIYTSRYNELQLMNSRLDKTHQILEDQTKLLNEKAIALELANASLIANQDLLEAQALELATKNTQLITANTDLQTTREGLIRTEKLKAMGQLASGVAHDFNNLLGAIISRCELLKLEYHNSPGLLDSIGLIHKSALDGAAVVKRIQDFSRVTADKNHTPINALELINDVVEMCRAIWKNKSQIAGINYDLSVEVLDSIYVLGYAFELREVLMNMILNSIDAMPGGGKLSISAVMVAENVEIKITDSGIGMDAETISRLFDPFFTTKGTRGNGLGLSVSHSIIERHEGSISVESQPGKGSTFLISLKSPHKEMIQTKDVSLKLKTLDSLKTNETHRILVVDDEEDVRRVLVEILELMGHYVVQAESGFEARDRYCTDKFDIVFTDLGMPGMNGWELADNLRANEKAENKDPALIVVVSGWGGQLKSSDINEHDVDLVLAKPFKIKEIQRIIENS